MNLHPHRFSMNSKIIRQFSLNVREYQKKNHYDCLGVTPKATQGDIKSAYYKLSKQHHPDVNKDNATAAEKFRDITAAYEVLGNLKARKLYDRGLLVTGGVEDYSSEEPKVDDLKHASFYRHRNKPASKQSVSSKTIHYNMDEWTRAHYSKTFSEASVKKSAFQDSIRFNQQVKRENESQWFVFSALIFFTSVALLASANSYGGFDTSSKFKTDEKPD